MEAETPAGIRHSMLLQNAETVRLIGPVPAPAHHGTDQGPNTAAHNSHLRTPSILSSTSPPHVSNGAAYQPENLSHPASSSSVAAPSKEAAVRSAEAVGGSSHTNNSLSATTAPGSVQSNIAHLALAMADDVSTSLTDLPRLGRRRGGSSPSAASAAEAAWQPPSTATASQAGLQSNIAHLALAAGNGAPVAPSQQPEASSHSRHSTQSSRASELSMPVQSSSDVSSMPAGGLAHALQALDEQQPPQESAQASAHHDNAEGGMNSRWQAISVSQIQVGDAVWVMRQAPARHTGISIQEQITEK